jgi:hypothetical protein
MKMSSSQSFDYPCSSGTTFYPYNINLILGKDAKEGCGRMVQNNSRAQAGGDGYVSGEISFNKSQNFYLFIGVSSSESFNKSYLCGYNVVFLAVLGQM